MCARRKSHDRLGGVSLELGQSTLRGDADHNDDGGVRLDTLWPRRLPLHGRGQLLQRPAGSHHLHQVSHLLLARRTIYSLPNNRGKTEIVVCPCVRERKEAISTINDRHSYHHSNQRHIEEAKGRPLLVTHSPCHHVVARQVMHEKIIGLVPSSEYASKGNDTCNLIRCMFRIIWKAPLSSWGWKGRYINMCDLLIIPRGGDTFAVLLPFGVHSSLVQR